MSYTDNCVVVPSVGLGQWQLSTNDSLVTAIIPRVITGQTYYFGIEGKIVQIGENSFIVKNVRRFDFTSIDSTGQVTIHRDSSVFFYIYIN